MRNVQHVVLAACVMALLFHAARGSEEPKPPDKPKAQSRPVALNGYMADMPKVWARLVALDAEGRTITFQPDGKEQSVTLPLGGDAQVHFQGFWGERSDFVPGLRVWLWIDVNRDKKWVAVRMLADELSGHALHGNGGTVKAIDSGRSVVTVAPPRGDPFELRLSAQTRVERGGRQGGLDLFQEGDELLYQQRWADGGYVASLVLDKEAFHGLRIESRKRAEERWVKDGFAGDVTWMHPPQGEMRVLLHAPAMRWARALDEGDKLELSADGRAKLAASVVSVQPLYEKTELHVVVEGVDQVSLALGKPVRVFMQRASLLDDDSPPDLGRPRDRQARLDWFLSSLYCTCGNAGDVCAGHFYTLAACNHMRCAMPSLTLKEVGGMIDAGHSDAEILTRLRKDRGPLLLQQHILP